MVADRESKINGAEIGKEIIRSVMCERVENERRYFCHPGRGPTQLEAGGQSAQGSEAAGRNPKADSRKHEHLRTLSRKEGCPQLVDALRSLTRDAARGRNTVNKHAMPNYVADFE